MNRPSCSGRTHLITTCTRRKTVAAGETVFPITENVDAAYSIWTKLVMRACSEIPPIKAGELYTGQHWRRAATAAADTGAELWVISAGLGLLHVTDQIVPYEATFNSMPFSHRELWSHLTARPPTERQCASLTELMLKHPNDCFVIAASPVYLRAVEEDLRVGSENLVSPEQLIIVTSKAWQMNLNGQIYLTHAGMMGLLNTNMTGLNISYAAQLIQNESELYGTTT